eukprot:SAG31_NODE_182_length_21094_cov_4.426721_13_plen_43_part_00
MVLDCEILLQIEMLYCAAIKEPENVCKSCFNAVTNIFSKHSH